MFKLFSSFRFMGLIFLLTFGLPSMSSTIPSIWMVDPQTKNLVILLRCDDNFKTMIDLLSAKGYRVVKKITPHKDEYHVKEIATIVALGGVISSAIYPQKNWPIWVGVLGLGSWIFQVCKESYTVEYA